MTQTLTNTTPIVDFRELFSERREAVMVLLAELPADSRRAVEMLYLEACSVTEVARRLSMSLCDALALIERTMDLLKTMALLAFPELCWRERAA